MGTLSSPAASSGAAPGTPVLHGPYVVDYTDIPHDGDTTTLWTPAVGDIVLSVVVDVASSVQWSTAGGVQDQGSVRVGQDTGSGAAAWMDGIGGGAGAGYAQIPNAGGSKYRITSADPVRVLYFANGDGDLTAGHVELFALIARPVAP